MAKLSLRNLARHYGATIAVSDVTLDVAQGEFLVLLGPSGCGKTTTLRMIAGFVEPSAGTIAIDGRDVTRLPPWKRNVGLVFQSYALFPHMRVDENVAFGLEMRGMAAEAIAARVDEVLRLVRLEGLNARLPRELSGGQQQRVALARALAIRPDVLLLDEPLSNLDAKLRAEVRVEIRELQKALDLTTIMVTHDQEEALTMADRLVVMSEGAVRQIGTQRELYEQPADLFVAGFIGRSNIFAGVMKSPNIFQTEGGLAIACHSSVSGPARLVLKPERIAIGPAAVGLANRFDAQVEFVSYLGAILELRVRINDRDRFVAQIANRPGIAEPRIGERLPIGWPAEAAFVFAESASNAKDPQ